MSVGSGRVRAEAVARLGEAVEAFASALEGGPEPQLTGGEWGPREMLCHIVFWHETYVRIARAMNSARQPEPLVGAFPEFNRRSVVDLGHVPVTDMVARLRRAQRMLAVELLALPPAARIRIKTGAGSRGPLEFAVRIDAHIRGHLDAVRRSQRRAGLPCVVPLTAHRRSVQRPLQAGTRRTLLQGSRRDVLTPPQLTREPVLARRGSLRQTW